MCRESPRQATGRSGNVPGRKSAIVSGRSFAHWPHAAHPLQKVQRQPAVELRTVGGILRSGLAAGPAGAQSKTPTLGGCFAEPVR